MLGLKKNTSLATLKEIFSQFRISLAGDPVKNVTIDSEFGTAIVVFKDHAGILIFAIGNWDKTEIVWTVCYKGKAKMSIYI